MHPSPPPFPSQYVILHTALFAILHVQLECWWLSLCVWMVRSHQARNAKLTQTDGCLSCLPARLPAALLALLGATSLQAQVVHIALLKYNHIS